MARTVVGLVCGAAVASFGALLLGEYEFTGLLPYIAGPLFGLAVGEVVVGVGHSRERWTAAVAGVASFGGIVWAGWIDSGDGLQPLHPLVWLAAALAGLCAFFRTVDLRPASR